MTVGVLYDELYLDHRDHMFPHPECPERLIAVQEALKRSDVPERTLSRTPRPATRDELLRVHKAGYYDLLADKVPGNTGRLDGDTYFSEGSWAAALNAAGGAVDLALDVFRSADDLRAGLGLVRPPGHHAEADHGMGFCIFNNVAVAAEALRQAGAARLAIMDWDVHHGNGTQHTFERRQDVLYVSTHRYPFYPGTGSGREIGRGEGEGFTVNVPLPGGAGDAEYVAVFDQIVVPVIEQFKPDILLLSAGFDAHKHDPLGGMGVSDRGYRVLSRKMRRVAEMVCQGKLVALLEGGYDVQALGRVSVAFLEEMLADAVGDDGEITETPHAELGRLLDELKRVLEPHWNL